MPEYHQYGEYKIPVTNARSVKGRGGIEELYNLRPDEIDDLRCGTNGVWEPGGFRGTSFDDAGFSRLDDQEVKERIEFQKRNKCSILHLFEQYNVPVKDQNGHGYCLLPDALIRMADGTDKPIFTVNLFDKVFTAEGNIGEVSQLHARDYAGEMATVKLWGHSHLTLTPNHSVLTERGYVPSGELIKGDWVRLPRTEPAACRVIQTAQHVAPVKQYAGAGRSDETWNNHSVKHLPDFIELTRGFGRLVGLYAAEGFKSDKHALSWAFNVNESDTLAAEVMALLSSELGEVAGYKENKQNGCIVRLYGKQWVSLFESLCGKYSHHKQLHGDVMSGPVEFLEGVLSGWLDGDGCNKTQPNGTTTQSIGATVSKSLAANMFAIANRLGCRPSINRETPQQNKHAQTRRPVWKVSIASKSDNFRVKQDSGATWRKVKEVTLSPYCGKVYNIGVEGDNSYIAEGIGVHNCWSYGAISCIEANRLVQGLPYVELSPHSVAAGHMKGRDQGGWASMALSWAEKYGVVPDADWPKHSRNHKLWDKPEIKEAAAPFKPLEWIDIPERDMAAERSLLASNFACGMGIPWWGHLIMFGILDWSDKHGWLYGQRNSHGPNFGWKGWAFHTEKSAMHMGGSTVRVAT